MAIVSRPATLLSIPKELRLMIWERVFPELQYFGGVHEYGCLPDVSRSQFVRLYGNDPEAAPSCFCNYYRLQPLFICKQTYDGMKYVLDKADIHADFTSTIPRGLRPSLYKRIRALTLSESVFPVLSCQLGFLEHVRYDDFLSTFPSLEKITMPSHELGWSMDLRFPSSIPFHIDGCLNSRDGPASMPTANMIELVRGDLAGMGYGRAFNAVETIVINGKIEISSTYRYRVIVSRQFEWPFSDIMKDIFDEKYEGTIVWDKDSMRINNIPDFRGEPWWKERLREREFRSARPQWLDAKEFDWTSELGGWDLMNLLKRDYSEQQYWVGAIGRSFPFT